MLVPHSVVSASNLQWKQALSPCNDLLPCVYATEMSTFSSHPRQEHLKQALRSLRGEISLVSVIPFILKLSLYRFTAGLCGAKLYHVPVGLCGAKLETCGQKSKSKLPRMFVVDLREFVSSCRDKLKSIVHQTNKVITPLPYKASNSTSKLVTPLHRPLNNNAEEIRPPSAAERKLAKLELYGDPPPLSPLVLPRLRGALRKEFKAPQRISHSPVHSETSPPLSLDSLSE
uniref:BRCA2 OB3 domain-containing protein n=1 Tax=Timema poppense TaxID=170557 RepID=A0A7R9HH04_TIMPO|nr:unnamed protein product [Timema poppensis]